VLLLGLVYGAFTTAALLHLSPQQLAATRSPQMLLAAALWGEPGRWLMLAVSTAAVLMAFNAGVLGASRLVYGLSREGCLPRALSATHADSGAPVRAIALTVGASLACSLLVREGGSADLFANVAAIAICLCYAALLAASLTLARRQSGGDARRPQAIEGTALVLMVLLLAALLLDTQAWRQTLMAAIACTLIYAAAAAVNGRADASTRNPSTPARAA
jgi:amino acid transporter